jgi:hypothetical protein
VAPLVSIHRLDDDLEVPPYVIELMKDAPLHPAAVAEEPPVDARRLDTTRLGLQINHMLSQLRQRITPAQLGLGEETSGHVITLLDHLARPWTQSASPRRFRRFATQGVARVAVGFEAMHFASPARSLDSRIQQLPFHGMSLTSYLRLEMAFNRGGNWRSNRKSSSRSMSGRSSITLPMDFDWAAAVPGSVFRTDN